MRVLQLIEALDFGDAVSTHTIEIRNMLNALDISNEIYSKYVHDKVQHLRKPLDSIRVSSKDLIFFHFSGKTSLLEQLKQLPCKKAIIYHNITPHYFFEDMEPHYQHCLEGREQLKEMVSLFDLYIGDSQFNVDELSSLGCSPCRVMPIIVDMKIKGQRKKYGGAKLGTKFLFVGRVAPNKKHEDIIRVFDYYCTYIDPKATLYLVGNYNDYMPYYDQLQQLIKNLPSKNRIIFTGKVSSEELTYHYNSADIFLCMSEHEGFCVPLLESMSYGLPTIAFDSGAISTTMGKAGVLIKEKRYDDIAELIDYLLQDQKTIQTIIDKQYEWLERFSLERSQQLLLDIVKQMGYES